MFRHSAPSAGQASPYLPFFKRGGRRGASRAPPPISTQRGGSCRSKTPPSTSLRSATSPAEAGEGQLPACHEMSCSVRNRCDGIAPAPARHSDRSDPADRVVEESRRRRSKLVRRAESRSLHSLRSVGMTGGEGTACVMKRVLFIYCSLRRVKLFVGAPGKFPHGTGPGARSGKSEVSPLPPVPEPVRAAGAGRWRAMADTIHSVRHLRPPGPYYMDRIAPIRRAVSVKCWTSSGISGRPRMARSR